MNRCPSCNPETMSEIWCPCICDKLEIHADGVKEVKCEFCDVNCGNDYCYTNRKEDQ